MNLETVYRKLASLDTKLTLVGMSMDYDNPDKEYIEDCKSIVSYLMQKIENEAEKES